MNYVTLNENNLQTPFLFNGTESKENLKTITETRLIDLNKGWCVNPPDSDFIVIDLGYTIDGNKNNWNFVIDNIGLNIQVCATRNDIQNIVMQNNDILIVSDDEYFRTVVLLKYRVEVLNKTLEFTIESSNTSLSSFMMDTIANKLNQYDPEATVKRFETVENRATNLETRATNLEAKDIELTNTINSNKADADNKIQGLDTRLTTAETEIDELQKKTQGISYTDKTVIPNLQVDTLTVGANAQGFKYVLQKTGTITDTQNISEISFIQYETFSKVKGTLTLYDTTNLQSLATKTITVALPIGITNVTRLLLHSNDINFVAVGEVNKNNINVTVRNIDSVEQNINGITFDISMDCDLNTQQVTYK